MSAREKILREALNAINYQRLYDDTSEPDDAVYNQAIEHAYKAVLDLIHPDA